MEEAEDATLKKKKNNENKKKKKKRGERAMEMKLLVVQCSVPPADASSFPTLAVARRIIHTHASTPFPACTHHDHHHLQQQHHQSHGTFETLAVAPPLLPPPPLIINHSCPCSAPAFPHTMQQQVLLRDAMAQSCQETQAEAMAPLPPSEKQHCYTTQAADIEAEKLWSPSPPLPTPKKAEALDHKASQRSISSSLLAAAGDGSLLAAELLHHLKESFCSTLPQSVRVRVSDDWDSILSSNVLEQYMDKLKASLQSLPPWLMDPLSFNRVIKKVGRIEMPEHHRHSCIEDLLQTIASFERAGLINEIQSLGFAEEACILRDRSVFYGLFARTSALQEVFHLLGYMRSEIGLRPQDTWSLACSDAQRRNCLKEICLICNYPDKIKTFAWKLDKLELCANETDCIKTNRVLDSASIDIQLRKLLGSPLGTELPGLCVVSYLDTAVSLLQHYTDIFESLREHGFSEK